MASEAPIPHPGEWPVVRLADLTLKIGSGATPMGGEDSYLRTRSRFALIRSQNVLNRRFDTSGLVFISDEQAERLAGVRIQAGDLLLNITGDGVTFARCCAVPAEILPACVNQHVAIVRVDPRLADAGYILSYLTHPQVKIYIESFNAGGSRRAITKGHIESFRLPLPPLSQQRAISYILGTLDDKIELNRRMNETLEAMACALFKSWFVDFDPVRAKAKGRDPGLPKPLADLFPDSFKDSAVGPIPSCWRLTTWGELVSLEYGKSLSEYDGEDRPYPVYGTNGRIGSHSEPLCTHPGIVVGRKGAYRGVHFCNKPFFVIDTAFYVEPRRDVEVRWVYYELLRQDINTMNSGSAIPSTSRGDFYSMAVVYPSFEVQQAFVQCLRPCWIRQEENRKQSSTLAVLRNVLLPRLVSGELRLKDAEKIAAGAL